MKRLLPAVVICSLISGCASISSVIPRGNDIYTITAQGGGFHTRNGLLEDLYKEAEKYCTSKGMAYEVVIASGQDGRVSLGGSGGGYYGGTNAGAAFLSGLNAGLGTISTSAYGSAELTFRCVKKQPQQTAGNKNIAGHEIPYVDMSANGSSTRLYYYELPEPVGYAVCANCENWSSGPLIFYTANTGSLTTIYVAPNGETLDNGAKTVVYLDEIDCTNNTRKLVFAASSSGYFISDPWQMLDIGQQKWEPAENINLTRKACHK